MRIRNVLIFLFILLSGERLLRSQLLTDEIQASNFNQNLIANDSSSTKIHIVKEGDTLSSISKLYAINKELLIELNNLENENYIYIGQNLKLIQGNENVIKKDFHIVENGDTLTEISSMYNISIKDLIEFNNIENPNSLIAGKKIILKRDYIEINGTNNIELLSQAESLNNIENFIYGPLRVLPESLIIKNNKVLLNAIHKNGKELVIALKCEMEEIDVRKKGHKWQGWQEAEKDFEVKLLQDYC